MTRHRPASLRRHGQLFELPAKLGGAKRGVATPAAAVAARVCYWGPSGWHALTAIGRTPRSEAPCPGPLIIEEHDATTMVPPDAVAWRDGAGNVMTGLSR